MPWSVQGGADLVWAGGDVVAQEQHCYRLAGLWVQLDVSLRAGAVDGDTQGALAFLGMHLGHIDVAGAERGGLERLFCGFIAFDIRQAADAMPFEATVEA
jgi:hypothetical protein